MCSPSSFRFLGGLCLRSWRTTDHLRDNFSHVIQGFCVYCFPSAPTMPQGSLCEQGGSPRPRTSSWNRTWRTSWPFPGSTASSSFSDPHASQMRRLPSEGWRGSSTSAGVYVSIDIRCHVMYEYETCEWVTQAEFVRWVCPLPSCRHTFFFEMWLVKLYQVTGS